MRFTGNFFSEWARRGGSSSNHSLLISLVACAVVAAASGAVILSLVGSPVAEPNRSSVSPRAIVRAAATPEATENTQGRANVETPPQPAMTSRLSSGAEPVTQTESEQPTEVPSQQSQKHNHQRTRESHWQGRLAHAFWPFRHISSRREELTSGAR
jgi:hypothetical protein